MPPTHRQQQQIWDQEHKTPYVLLQMDSKEASSGVLQFIEWLQLKKKLEGLRGIELGCGKGRNVIKLAQLGLQMTGLDFSPSAVKEAKKRAQESGVEEKSTFLIQDVTKTWPFPTDTFDIAIDCFATTDIESVVGRKHAVAEILRVLKPGGYVLAYLLSPEDEFHQQMILRSPAKEKNAFLHSTTGKFEKTFDRDEVLKLYGGLRLVEEKRVKKLATFFGKQYKCYHHWMVFTK